MANSFQQITTFSKYRVVHEIVQTICVATSFKKGIIFLVSRLVGQLIAEIFPVNYFPFLPSKLVYKASEKNNKIFRYICWLAPISGIGVATFAANKYYVVSTSFLAKGAICGIHETMIRILSYPPYSSEKLINLNGCFEKLFLNPKINQSIKPKLKLIESKSELMAFLIMLISSISLTLILRNPILANASAYPLVAIVKVATMRVFGEMENRKNIVSGQGVPSPNLIS